MDKVEPSKTTAKTQKQLDKEQAKAATQKKRLEVALQKNAEKQLKASRKTIKVRMPKTAKPLTISNCQELLKEEDAIITAINNYKRNGISVLDHLHEETLLSMLEKANEVYRNLGPDDVLLMNDNQYDILEDYMKKKYPKNSGLGKIGAPVERNKVTLPYHMASMDKIKPDTGALTAWKSKYKGAYVMSCKLDGVSGLYSTENGELKLYTRGDGTVGQDISHFLPYLKLPKVENAVVRGEFIMTKATFNAKYKDHFANPRNLIAGTINRLTVNDVIYDINFVAYEVLVPSLTPSEQMAFLQNNAFNTVRNGVRDDITNELLSGLLVQWRTDYEYEIDGVIVTNDKIYPRKLGNPDHSFAFKMVLSDQMAETKVVDVHWTASKDGYLKPRVQIEPVHLSGVKIEYATGFNGAFIKNNRIGVGALINIIRSGDVIPYIKDVITPADEGKMPSVSYIWNESQVDVMLEDKDNDTGVMEKNITGFFRGIEVDGLSEGNVKRIMEAGFDTMAKIMRMSKDDFLTIEGFKDKMATKIHDGIASSVEKATIPTIMAASNMFGRGFSTKKIGLILDEYPNVLVSAESIADKKRKLAEVKGMASKTADNFVDNIPKFISFLQETGLEGKLELPKINPVAPVQTTHELYKKVIVMSGTRDKELEARLAEIGASVGSAVSSNTYVVVTPDVNSTSSKLVQARKLSIPIMTPSEFRQRYLV
jgi:NAD-dependent DNA ligase